MTMQTQAQKRKRKDKEGVVTPNTLFSLTWKLVILSFGVLYALYPIWMVVAASFDPRNTAVGASLWPSNASFANYNELFNNPVQTPIVYWLGNSIFVSSISTFVTLVLTTLAAYSLSRFRFNGRRTTLLATLVIQVFPTVVALVAFYLLLTEIGKIIPFLGTGQLGGLILIYCGGALGGNAFLMKGYFDTIPRDLDEAARVDGAGEWLIFWRIILPQIRPILAVVGLLSFIGTFNDFLLPRVLLRDVNTYTLAVGLTTFIGTDFSQRWGVFAAGALIGAVPITVVFLALQTQLVGGLTSGAVKG